MNLDERLLQDAENHDNRAKNADKVFMVVTDGKLFSSDDDYEQMMQDFKEVKSLMIASSIQNKELEFGYVYDSQFDQRNWDRTYKGIIIIDTFKK